MRGKGVGWGGRLFEAGRLLTFSAFRMGAYSRWALIRGWALIRINTVCSVSVFVRVGSQISPRRAKKYSNIPSLGRTRSVKCHTPGPTTTIKSPLHALPPPLPRRHDIDRCITGWKGPIQNSLLFVFGLCCVILFYFSFRN